MTRLENFRDKTHWHSIEVRIDAGRRRFAELSYWRSNRWVEVRSKARAQGHRHDASD
jgi:hypothetical protein